VIRDSDKDLKMNSHIRTD